jgi:hypothetical protein
VSDGPVVVVNISKSRCDALALLPGRNEVRHIPLPNFSHRAASILRRALQAISDTGFRETTSPEVTSETRFTTEELGFEEVQSLLQEMYKTLGDETESLGTADGEMTSMPFGTRTTSIGHSASLYNLGFILGVLWIRVVQPILHGLSIKVNGFFIIASYSPRN